MKGDCMMENNRQISAQQLMRRLSEAMFFANDLKLYLDTHPDDTRALRMFREACKNSEVCREAFEKRCYPLIACSSDCENEWEWLDGVWPSQKMA